MRPSHGWVELEATLNELVSREVQAAAECIPDDCRELIVELLHFAGSNLAGNEDMEHWAQADKITRFPAVALENGRSPGIW